MDKKTRIINNILLSVMFICFVPLFFYGLTYVYSIFNLPIFEGGTVKSYIGDILLCFVLPLCLVIMGIYKYSLNSYYKLLEKESNDTEFNKNKIIEENNINED